MRELTDAERVRGLLEVNARQAETIERLQNAATLMRRRINRLTQEVRELRGEQPPIPAQEHRS